MTKSVTSSVTLEWLIPNPPLKWANAPEEVPPSDLSPSYFWQNAGETDETYQKRGQEREAPPAGPRHYPRLVRDLEPFVQYEFRRPPERLYEHLAKLTPIAFGDSLLEDTDPKPLHLEVQSKKYLAFARKHGMLLHPDYGDSAFGWAAVSFQFQFLSALQSTFQLEIQGERMHEGSAKSLDPLGYEPTLKRLFKQRQRVHFGLLGIWHNLESLATPVVLLDRLRRKHEITDAHPEQEYVLQSPIQDNSRSGFPPQYLWEKPPAKTPLKRDMRVWLHAELNNSLNRNKFARSETYLHLDQSREASDLLESRGHQRLNEGEAYPYIGMKAGLYACALFQFLADIRSGGELRTCAGCGRFFLPSRSNNLHCPTSTYACRKRAQRNREAEEKAMQAEREANSA